MQRSTHVLILSLLITASLGGGGLWYFEKDPVPAPESADTAAAEETPPVARHVEAQETAASDRRATREVDVPILIYHTVRPWRANDGPDARRYNVTPEILDAHLRLLEGRGYESVTFGALEDAVLRGGDLPEKPVLISFDDGTASHYTRAFPLLKRHGFTATFFVFTNAIDRPNYLTSAQILEMREAGMRFGNHTRYHQYLTRLPPAEALEEMRVGKDRLEEMLNEQVDVIAYPFGLYDEDVVRQAALLGHRMGRTINEGRVHGPDGLMTLRGYQMTDSIRRLEYALSE